MTTLRELIGSGIRQARTVNRSWTQAELGAALEPWLGRPWAKQQVLQAEQGQRSFEPGEMVALARVFDLPMWSFMKPELKQSLQLVNDGPEIAGAEIRRALWGGPIPPSEGMLYADVLKDRASALEQQARELLKAAAQLEEDAIERGKQ
jgi:hypothetical protein